MIDYNNCTVMSDDTVVGYYNNGVREVVVDNFIVNYKMKETLEEFLLFRVMPKAAWRDDCREFYGIPEWNPLEICKLTHGMMPIDHFWIKFNGESDSLNWDIVQQQIW